MNDSAISLLKKLKALSERGVGGEKYNAQQALNKFLAKNNMKLEDLEEIEVKEFSFKKVSARYSKIFFGIVVNVVPDLETYYKSPSYIWIRCTESQKVEINMKYDFYKKAYNRQLKTFLIAFLQKNDLTRKVETMTEMSEKEIEEMRKAQLLARGMEASAFYKRIER